MGRIKFEYLPHGWDVELNMEDDGRYMLQIRAPNAAKNALLAVAGLFTAGIAWTMIGPSVHKRVYFHSRNKAYSFFNKVVVASRRDRPR